MFQEWSEALQRKELEKALRSHWCQYVPVVFARGHDAEKEQRYADTFLFHPLEKFLCGGEPSVKFQELKEMDAPSQICGHVFRTGEPTYSCRWEWLDGWMYLLFAMPSDQHSAPQVKRDLQVEEVSHLDQAPLSSQSLLKLAT